MKPHLQELLTDLQAAAIIGLPDTVYNALEQVRGLTEEELPTSALLPLGRALTPLPTEELRSLVQDADPAVRALAAAGMGHRFLLGKDVAPGDLLIPAGDSSFEVRLTLVEALSGFPAGGDPQRDWLSLVEACLQLPSAFRQMTGLALLSKTNPLPEKLINWLAPLQTAEDREFRQALVDAVNTLAGNGHAEAVLRLVAKWADSPDANIWVITRVLSAGWAQMQSDLAVAILQKLAKTVGENRAIRRAIERHRDTP